MYVVYKEGYNVELYMKQYMMPGNVNLTCVRNLFLQNNLIEALVLNR